VVKIAWPSEIVRRSSMVGGMVLVSMNCTIPVTVFGDTVAVNVTGWLTVDGFCDDTIMVAVGVDICLTICANADETLAA